MSARKGLWLGAIGLAMWAGLAGGVAHADFIVVPNSLANTEGNAAGSQIPFLISQPIRYQQAFHESQFPGPVCITEILFRPDAAVDSWLPSTIADIQINLSTTSKAPDELSRTFAENVGVNDDTVVFDTVVFGPLTLSSSNTGPAEGPKDFDIRIPLTSPFSYNPSLGNLLLDVRKFSTETPPISNVLDTHSDPQDSIAHVFGTNPAASETLIPRNTTGLVTQFTFTQGPCTDSGSGSEQRALLDLDPDVFEVAVETYQSGEVPTEQFLTAFIEPPEGVSAADIDPNTVMLLLNETTLASAASFAVDGNVLIVKFPLTAEIVSLILGITAVKVNADASKNRIAVVSTTEPVQLPDLIELTVSGELTNGGSFLATDAVLAMMLSNHSPVADAGADQTVECTFWGKAKVHLDASGSSDPDGDPLTFTWTGPFGTLTGEHVKTKLPLGEHTITLTVDDGRGGTASDVTVVTVDDSKGPTIKRIRASPKVLWPPNHRMVPVTVSASVSDACHRAPRCHIYAVRSNERPGHNGPDWEVTGDLTLNLRAERSGRGDGRVYKITVKCKDDAGNSSTKTVTVRVPHDQGKWKHKIDDLKEDIEEKLNKVKKNHKH